MTKYKVTIQKYYCYNKEVMDNNGNPEFKDYMQAFKRMEKLPLIAKACLVIGCITMFLAVFFKYPTFIYFLTIGGAFVLFFLCYTLINYLVKKYSYRHGPKVTKVKEVKVKTVKPKKIEDDNEHIIVQCPYCKQKIRLPNIKGNHAVDCPRCKDEFKVEI